MNERLKELAEQAGGVWSEDWGCFMSGTLNLTRFTELIRQDERERIAKHFDIRIDPNQKDNGWYEPNEPAEIIREMK